MSRTCEQRMATKYNKHELLDAYAERWKSKEELFDELWELLKIAASNGKCSVEWNPPFYCSDFMSSPRDERLDKLYFFLHQELEKIGLFKCYLYDYEYKISVQWDTNFV